MISSIQNPVPVYLSDDQLQKLQALSQQTGASVVDLIRQSIDTLIHELPLRTGNSNPNGTMPPPDYDPIGELMGIFASNTTNTTDDHDRELAEIYEEEQRRWLEKSS